MPLPDEIATLAAEVSNWGRWGDDDELGCGNLLSAESTRRGTAAVRDGRRISLAAELKADGIQVGQAVVSAEGILKAARDTFDIRRSVTSTLLSEPSS